MKPDAADNNTDAGSSLRPTMIRLGAALVIGIAVVAGVLLLNRPHRLIGHWVSQEPMIEVPAGELEVRLNADGTGRLVFDRDKYIWWYDEFTYVIEGDRIIIEVDQRTVDRFEYKFTEGSLVLFITNDSPVWTELLRKNPKLEERIIDGRKMRFASFRRK